MSSTLEASIFTGKNFSENLRSIKMTGNNLTMKQMFDISEKLIVGRSDEIYGVNPINWEDSSWKHLSLIGDEEVISLSHAKVYVFSDSVLCLGKMSEKSLSNIFWEDKLTWFKSSPQYRALTQLMASQWNSSGIFSQDSPHSSSATKSKSSCQQWAIHQNNLKDGSSSCRCSMTSYGDLKTKNRNAGPRWKLLLVQEWTQPTYRGEGIGGLFQNHHMFTVLLAATAATAAPTCCLFTSGRKNGRLFIVVVDGKKTQNWTRHCTVLISVGDRGLRKGFEQWIPIAPCSQEIGGLNRQRQWGWVSALSFHSWCLSRLSSLRWNWACSNRGQSGLLKNRIAQ